MCDPIYAVSPTSQVRRVMEQNGLINMFALAFAALLFGRNPTGYHERLLLLTSLGSMLADTLLVFSSVGADVVQADLAKYRVMTFFEVIGWSVREIGLTLYTNKLVAVLDVKRGERLYHVVFWGVFALLCGWRLTDLGLRTYDPTASNSAGLVVKAVDPAYLGTLSALEIWSAAFLFKLTVNHIQEGGKDSNVAQFASRLLGSGVLRILAVNFIPAIRLIMNQTISSSFAYTADASSVIYYLQVSMNLMYLIDLAIVKMDSVNTFRGTGGGGNTGSSGHKSVSGRATTVQRQTSIGGGGHKRSNSVSAAGKGADK